jgi:hypothetical protein
LSVAVSFTEILDHFRGAGARLPEGDPAVLPERELLALQEYLDIAVYRDVCLAPSGRRPALM